MAVHILSQAPRVGAPIKHILAWMRPAPYFCIWVGSGAAKAECFKDLAEAQTKTLERSGVLIDARGKVLLDFL